MKTVDSSASTEFLLNPTYDEIVALSDLYTLTKLPLPFVILYKEDFYNNDAEIVAYGIPISTKIRQGVHARLGIVANAIDGVTDLREFKTKAASTDLIYGGVLFIDQDAEGPVLSYHTRNSGMSTIHSIFANNIGSKSISPRILKMISYKMGGVKVDVVSQELYNRINEITVKRWAAKGKKKHDGLDPLSAIKSYYPIDNSYNSRANPERYWDFQPIKDKSSNETRADSQDLRIDLVQKIRTKWFLSGSRKCPTLLE